MKTKKQTNKPETVTILQTEYDLLNSFWNEHHS